jgi:hypothetical protein
MWMWNRDNELFTELSSSEIGFSTAWNRSSCGPPHTASVVEVENESLSGPRGSQVGSGFALQDGRTRILALMWNVHVHSTMVKPRCALVVDEANDRCADDDPLDKL